MSHVFGLSISALLMLAGVCKVLWPTMLLDCKGGKREEPTPEVLSRSRREGFIMLAFGAVGLFAILTSDGTPPDFIGV